MNLSLKDAKIEGHLLGAILSWELGKGMLTGGLWVLSAESITGRVASLSSYPVVLASAWMLLALLMVPYFLMQAFYVLQPWRKQITRSACWATLGSGVIWTYLGYLSKNLDYTNITTIFVANGLTCIAMAGVLANSMNTAQINEEAKP